MNVRDPIDPYLALTEHGSFDPNSLGDFDGCCGI